ncbi:MAG TPA: hypothetical protein H9943_09065 [Candidatus Ruthenibacterium avium]|uniref:Uncharacterized protein n=1 Tax=Candidatus Ruthenibacterium avium TaxID=2838751 RepID=A0A9D2M2Z9_9FIRM|nr:hypothetical protein [Candidatus Ruthenibacterium avium]
MSNTQCQNKLASLEEAANKMQNFFDEIDVKEEWSVSEPDISDLEDFEDFEEWEERDMIPAAEYFTPLQDADHLIEKKHLQVGWAMYLATRSGYGEAALAYLTMNGSDAFIKTRVSSINSEIAEWEHRKQAYSTVFDPDKLHQQITSLFADIRSVLLNNRFDNKLLKHLIEEITVDEKGRVEIKFQALKELPPFSLSLYEPAS